MADVDDEVTPDVLDPSSLGAVINKQEYVSLSQRGHPGTNRDAATPHGTSRQIELDLSDDTVATNLSGQVTQLVVDQVVITDQSVGYGRRAGADDGIGGVQDYRS
jgi:hypothetical protein